MNNLEVTAVFGDVMCPGKSINGTAHLETDSTTYIAL